MSAPMPSVPKAHRVGEPAGVGVPDAVVEVGRRVVQDRALEVVIGGEMDTVCQQPVGPGQMAQPDRSLDVFGAFADMDVDSDPEIGGETGGRLQRFVGAGEGGVEPDQSLSTALDEPLVLCQPSPGAVGPMPIGDPIRGNHPDTDLARTRRR